jgi:hypothetical protein
MKHGNDNGKAFISSVIARSEATKQSSPKFTGLPRSQMLARNDGGKNSIIFRRLLAIYPFL